MLWHKLPAPLAVIFGPTAVGKTEVSIRVAEKLSAEIVSADSTLFYKGMDIGTAKPTPIELARAPHHLIDVSTPDSPWSLAVYKKAAEAAITDIQARGKLPLLVGGTGQYIHAVIENWDIPAQEADVRLRQVLSGWSSEIGADELHRKLGIIDPVAAGNIQASNVRRTIRALEVIFLTGRRFSEQRQRKRSHYSLLKIGLRRPRAELYQRIDARIQKMFADGFVDEVRGLLESGLNRNLPTLTAIGYREVIAYLDGKISLEEAVTLMKRRTRVFVRRQANWFKENDASIHWFTVGEHTSKDIIRLILSTEGWIEPALP